jgi:uncharacterized SAM-binding protein YcdF (DUF218 family)
MSLADTYTRSTAGKNSDFDSKSRYMLIGRTELAKADIALIFGNQHAYKPLAEEGARLYHEGFCDKIVISGGRKDDHGHIEAERIERHVLQNNVSRQDILLETKSLNTQENILLSKQLIGAVFGKKAITSVIAIGNIVAGRRFLMTLAKNWPDIDMMASNVNAFPYPVSDYGRHKESVDIVTKEYNKIAPYLAAGFISEIDIQSLNSRARKLPAPTPRGFA